MVSRWASIVEPLTTNYHAFIGDIMHIDVLGDHIIILDSLEAITELLEKRSSIYSDRPRMPMLKELLVSQHLGL